MRFWNVLLLSCDDYLSNSWNIVMINYELFVSFCYFMAYLSADKKRNVLLKAWWIGLFRITSAEPKDQQGRKSVHRYQNKVNWISRTRTASTSERYRCTEQLFPRGWIRIHVSMFPHFFLPSCADLVTDRICSPQVL